MDEYGEMTIQQLRDEIRRKDDQMDMYREHLYKAKEDLLLQESKMKTDAYREMENNREADKEIERMRLEQEKNVHQKRVFCFLFIICCNYIYSFALFILDGTPKIHL